MVLIQKGNLYFLILSKFRNLRRYKVEGCWICRTERTGKSHRAVWVARERGIDFIIDDGLLIRGAQIIAGKSAKKEKTKIAR